MTEAELCARVTAPCTVGGPSSGVVYTSTGVWACENKTRSKTAYIGKGKGAKLWYIVWIGLSLK